MGMGAIAWACLSLAIHQGPVKETFLNTRGIVIGFHLPKGANQVTDVNLLVSEDEGKTWVQGDHKTPRDTKFVYQAKHDGRYWFIVQEEHGPGRFNPANPARVGPNQILVVDTQKPQVQLTAERLPNGSIEARWTASDSYPDLHSLRLEYWTSGQPEGQPTPLGVSLSLQGKHEFDPGNAGKTGPVRVRVRMMDQAGNVGMDEKVVPAMTGAGGTTRTAEAPPFSMIPNNRNDQPGPINQMVSRQGPRPAVDSGPQVPLPPNGPPVANAPGSPPTPPAELSPLGPTPSAIAPPVAASSERTPPVPGGPADAPSATMPKVQIVNKPTVRLDFAVAKVGPSGLGAADVYVTLNKDGNWKKLPTEVPISLAAGADPVGSEIRGSVDVQLPSEGTIYGFIVAVKSKAGLAPPPPKPGDPPEVLVELDTRPPDAKLFKPAPDPSQANTLILAWSAVDRNLAETPITLEWSEHKEGPWKPIAATLPNSGQYAWQLPQQMPSRVFLRLTARDQAGNEARAQTDKPELIDLSVPQTKIIRVAPALR